MPDRARISYLTLVEAVQDIFIHQRTGALSLRVEQAKQRLLFLSGVLYLSGENPLRQQLETVLAGPAGDGENPRFDPRRYLERELNRLVDDLAEQMSAWETQELQFDDELEPVPDNIVGPVPTGVLVMDLCSRGLVESELLARLGGLDERYRASEELMHPLRVPELDRSERRLLERLRQAADIRTLIAESGGETSPLLAVLARLEAVRLVVVPRERETAVSPLSRELLADISRRVEDSLEARPIDLGEAAHRARLGKMLQDYGKQTYFELLNVDSASSAEEIHRNYMERARLAHPSHAAPLQMRDRGRRLEWLFSRLTDAYLVLSDPDRSAKYRLEMAEVLRPTVQLPAEETRLSERAALARENYLLARKYMDRDDYHFAIELLRQAVLADPRPEYHVLLGRCAKRNPNWLHMAVRSLREAVALRPDDEELRRELAETTDDYRRQMSDAEGRESDELARSGSRQGLARKLLGRIKGSGD